MEEPHRLWLEVADWFPDSVAAGEALSLRIRAKCVSGCDLRGGKVTILAPDGPVASAEIGSSDGKTFETEDFVIRAPPEVGAHDWSLLGEAPEDGCQAHAATLALSPFRTEAHKASLAVWDVRSPAVMGEPLSVKIGVKCAEGCNLRGGTIQVHNESDETLASAELSGEIWSGSDGLHWTDMELIAPQREGLVSWTARFSGTGLELPHDSASSRFGFATTRSPEHHLTVEVVEGGSAVPVSKAEVSLGVYRASTDQSGCATLAVAEGTYELVVWKTGYQAAPSTLIVSDDLTVRVEAAVLPDNSSWEDD